MREEYLGFDLGKSPALDCKEAITAWLNLWDASEQPVQTQVPATLAERDLPPKLQGRADTGGLPGNSHHLRGPGLGESPRAMAEAGRERPLGHRGYEGGTPCYILTLEKA